MLENLNLTVSPSTHQSFLSSKQNPLLNFPENSFNHKKIPFLSKPYKVPSKFKLKAKLNDSISVSPASTVEKGMPGVLSVKQDPDANSVNKDYSNALNPDENPVWMLTGSTMLFPGGSKHWVVYVEKPSANVYTKAQMVDHCVKILSEVLGNEKDAQMCLYHVSWLSNYGFSCMLDEECARELAVVPGVLLVQQDEHFESKIKDYGGEQLLPNASHSQGIETSKTKLFVTGLSFYTSEKTLRAAFEPFGELVEVKVIMDKISKRSKGYAFVEYASEDNATTALQEMNGKIINGWMIAVDRAKIKPRISKGRPRTMLS